MTSEEEINHLNIDDLDTDEVDALFFEYVDDGAAGYEFDDSWAFSDEASAVLEAYQPALDYIPTAPSTYLLNTTDYGYAWWFQDSMRN